MLLLGWGGGQWAKHLLYKRGHELVSFLTFSPISPLGVCLKQTLITN